MSKIYALNFANGSIRGKPKLNTTNHATDCQCFGAKPKLYLKFNESLQLELALFNPVV